MLYPRPGNHRMSRRLALFLALARERRREFDWQCGRSGTPPGFRHSVSSGIHSFTASNPNAVMTFFCPTPGPSPLSPLSTSKKAPFQALRSMARSILFSTAFTIPSSVLAGVGLPWLCGSMALAFQTFCPRSQSLVGSTARLGFLCLW